MARGCRQRVRQREAAELRADETRIALNSLCCKDEVSAGMETEQQAAALRHIAWCAQRRAPPVDLTPQEALRQLLRNDARYSEEGGESVGNMAPFGSGEVSLPAVSHRAPAVQDLLGDEGVFFERFEEKMLRSNEEYLRHIEDVGVPRIYIDPRLAQKKRSMRN